MYGQPVQSTAGSEIACNAPKTVGALFAFLGFALAAVGEFLTGAEFADDNPDGDDLRKFGLVCAIGILCGALGYFVTCDSLCGTLRDRAYFGNLLILVGFLCGVSFLFGATLPIDEASPQNESSVQSYSYLVGVAFLLVSLGWFVAFRDAIVCRLGVFNPSSLGHALITVFTFIAGILFIIYAYYFTFNFMDDDDSKNSDLDILAGVRIAAGVCDALIAIGFALALGECC